MNGNRRSFIAALVAAPVAALACAARVKIQGTPQPPTELPMLSRAEVTPGQFYAALNDGSQVPLRFGPRVRVTRRITDIDYERKIVTMIDTERWP